MSPPLMLGESDHMACYVCGAVAWYHNGRGRAWCHAHRADVVMRRGCKDAAYDGQQTAQAKRGRRVNSVPGLPVGSRRNARAPVPRLCEGIPGMTTVIER